MTLGGNAFYRLPGPQRPKPIVWPIIGPAGHEMTRSYPMRKVAGEKTDHVHHRSLWFTHGNVNGIDFWSEPGAGKIVHREYLKCGGRWLDRRDQHDQRLDRTDGKKQCEDVRTLTLQRRRRPGA